MLSIEQLICKDNKRHTDCHWRVISATYPDSECEALKQQITNRVTKLHIAHRLVHQTKGVLFTAKWGNDGKLFTH